MKWFYSYLYHNFQQSVLSKFKNYIDICSYFISWKVIVSHIIYKILQLGMFTNKFNLVNHTSLTKFLKCYVITKKPTIKILLFRIISSLKMYYVNSCLKVLTVWTTYILLTKQPWITKYVCVSLKKTKKYRLR